MSIGKSAAHILEEYNKSLVLATSKDRERFGGTKLGFKRILKKQPGHH